MPTPSTPSRKPPNAPAAATSPWPGPTNEGCARSSPCIDAGDAAWLDAVLERVADALEARPDLLDTLDPSREELRAIALGWLAHPDDVIALLNGTYRSPDQPDAQRVNADESAAEPVHDEPSP